MESSLRNEQRKKLRVRKLKTYLKTGIQVIGMRGLEQEGTGRSGAEPLPVWDKRVSVQSRVRTSERIHCLCDLAQCWSF